MQSLLLPGSECDAVESFDQGALRKAQRKRQAEDGGIGSVHEKAVDDLLWIAQVPKAL